MRLFSIFFFMGTLLIQFYVQPPSLMWTVLLLTGSLTLMVFFSSRFDRTLEESNKPGIKRLQSLSLAAVAFLAGLSLAAFSAQKQLDRRLPVAYEGQDIELIGQVDSIPEYRSNAVQSGKARKTQKIRDEGLRFRFRIQQAFDTKGRKISISGLVRLGWYKDWQALEAGEIWRLRVRLKRPNGFMNPGGFDYEKWLFSERIIATGYVRNQKGKSAHDNKRIAVAPWWSINYWRERIHKIIQAQVLDKPSAAVLSALSVADRSKLDRKQWEILQQTGTTHLIAISGLHIAIVAGFAFLPVLLIWRIFPRLNEVMPLRVAGGVSAIFFAGFYAMLAGFTLPTQRALLMVTIGILGLISRRHYPATSILAAALIGVLILDPLAPMSVSFWLSFIAVGLILLIAKRQMRINHPRLHLVQLQVLLSLGMFPLTLIFFGSGSISAPLANLIAIPWVALVIAPLTLLGVLLMPVFGALSDAFFNIAALAVHWLFKWLEFLSSQAALSVEIPQLPLVYLLMAFAGFLYLLAPKGVPGRWLAFIFISPALLFTPDKPPPGAFDYTLLDVGQGMASVLRTANHTLVYDVGKRLNDRFDMGRLVVLPYLKAKGVRKIDLLVLSHEDNDHRGGAQAVLENRSVDRIESSDLSILPAYDVTPCREGEKWNWDGVDFEVLSPPQNWIRRDETKGVGNTRISDNNRSCVLRISNKHHSLLLTGDIEKQAEQQLVSKYPNLQTEVMIAPHHGSKTSSSEAFLSASQAKLALLPVGYRNRFGHPKADVIQRYKDKGITVLDTVENGALELSFPATNEEIEIKAWRKIRHGFWSR